MQEEGEASRKDGDKEGGGERSSSAHASEEEEGDGEVCGLKGGNMDAGALIPEEGCTDGLWVILWSNP